MADTYQVSIRLQPEAVRRAEGLADGWKVPRVDVLRRAIDAGLPVLEAEGLEAVPAVPETGPTLADVLAEVRTLRGELPDLADVLAEVRGLRGELPDLVPVRGVSDDAGPIGLLIGAVNNLEAAAALITRAAESLAVHADDAYAMMMERLPGVRAAAAEVRALVRKLEGRAVAPAPASAPRTPEHVPAQLDIEHDATTLACAGAEPEERRADDRPVAGEWARRVGAGNRAYSHRLLRETAGGMAEVACGHENLALVELRRSPEGARLCPKCEAAAD